MLSDLLNTALTYRQSGLQAVPSREGKRPVSNWRDLQHGLLSEQGLIDLFNDNQREVAGVGIITGKVSGGLEVIDVDAKYDLTGSLYADFKQLIDDNLPDLIDSWVIGATKNGGYHIYYQAADIAGSQKLARRPTNADELSKHPQERVKVLIETRGEGAFVVVAPTAGYTVIQGDFSNLPVLTAEQRTILFAVARSFNEEPEVEPVRPQEPKSRQAGEGISPFADYNQRGDVIDLLTRHGWSTVSRQGQRIHLKRPGDSDTKTSGNFHEQLRKLYVFSSSTQFEPEKAYSPSDVYILLECNGDKSRASKDLRDMGYGTSEPIRPRATKVRTEHVHIDMEDANGDESQPVNKEGELTEEAIRGAKGETMYVRFDKTTPRIEVIQSLDLIERTRPDVPLYVLEMKDLKEPHYGQVECYRPYEFRAKHIFDSYSETYAANNNYVGPEQEDAFINEFITVGQALKDPFDRERFRTLFLRFSEHNDLGITQATLDVKLEQLRFSLEKEAQSNELEQLLDKAAALRKKGDLSKALTELTERSREIGAKAKAETFRVLTTPVNEADLAARMKKKPTDLLTGLFVDDGYDREEIRLPAGAISIIAAPTSHGKTAMLLNMAIKVALDFQANKTGKSVHILGFEEDTDSMLVRAINTYVAKELSVNNQRTIASYYRNQDYFKQNKADFERLKASFFDDLITPGRFSAQYVEYDSDTLIEAINFLHKEGNAGAVFIDYIQLLRKANWKGTSRQEEIKQICLDLKDVSVSTGLPIILAAQFNRQVVNPLRMHPTAISEAGDIERVANVLVAVWNNNKKMLANESELDMLSEKGYRNTPNTMYVELLKNRGGKPDLTGMLDFNGNTGVITTPQFAKY